MSNPADDALGRLLSSGSNAWMLKDAIDHVAQPSANEAIVGQRDAESALEKYGPKIHDESCAEANNNSGKQQFTFHGLPDVDCSCLTSRFSRPRRRAKRLEPECNHIESGQQARSHLTNLHLDEMAAIIT